MRSKVPTLSRYETYTGKGATECHQKTTRPCPSNPRPAILSLASTEIAAAQPSTLSSSYSLRRKGNTMLDKQLTVPGVGTVNLSPLNPTRYCLALVRTLLLALYSTELVSEAVNLNADRGDQSVDLGAELVITLRKILKTQDLDGYEEDLVSDLSNFVSAVPAQERHQAAFMLREFAEACAHVTSSIRSMPLAVVPDAHEPYLPAFKQLGRMVETVGMAATACSQLLRDPDGNQSELQTEAGVLGCSLGALLSHAAQLAKQLPQTVN